MTGVALIRPLSAVAWELRAAWATGRRVAVSLERADLDRVEGHVTGVAGSGAWIRVADIHIPIERVLAVHLPSRLGDSTIADDERFHGRARRVQLQELELPLDGTA